MLDAMQNYRVAWRIYGKVDWEAAKQSHESAVREEFERGSPIMVDVEVRNIQSTTFPIAPCASMLRVLCTCPTNVGCYMRQSDNTD